MARKVYISFLGTNNYLQCHYSVDGKNSVLTRFVQEALINHYCMEWTENDEIIIFGTSGANGSIQKNWCDNGQEKVQENKEIENRGLYGILKSKNIKAKLNNITPIPEGFSENEIWEIFNIVFEQLQLDDEIYLDVTHAFRSIPIFSVILFNYARLLKNTKLVAIHYGAFEKLGPVSEVKLIPGEQRIAPVLDLMPFVSLQDWTIAARNFIDYGKADKIHKLLEEKYKQINRVWEGKNQEANKLKDIDKNLIRHSESIISNRIDDIIKGNDLKKALLEAKQADTVVAPAFKPLLGKIEEKVKDFSQNDLNNIFSATEWCIQHELFQNAYSILLEGTISLMLNQINEVYSGQTFLIESKRGTIIHAAQSFQHRKSKEECIKLYRIDDKLKNETTEIHDVIEKIWDLLNEELANTIVALNAKRNSYMHGGTGTNPLGSFQNLKSDIEKYYRQIKTHFTPNNQKRITTPGSATRMLINLSNHPLSNWSEPQKKTARDQFGQVTDLPFPAINPAGDETYIRELVAEYLLKVQTISQGTSSVAIHIMGEMTFTFAMVIALQKYGYACVASTTERITVEQGGIKNSEFRFLKFREYGRL